MEGLKVYCKKTYAELNRNFFTVGGAGYNQYWDKWIKGNSYFAYEPKPIEKRAGIYLWITSENPNNPNVQTRGPVTKLTFENHFMSVIEYRQHLLEELFGD